MFESLVPWRARPNFRWDALSGVLSGLYVGGIFPFIGFIARDHLGASGTELGLIAAAPYVGNLLAMPFTHMLSRRRPVENTALLVGLARALLVAISFVYGSAIFAWIVFAVQCLASIPGPTNAAVLRAIYPRQFLGRMLSYTRFGMAAGMILTTLVAGVLIDRFSWRWVFVMFAPIGLLSALVFARVQIPGDQPVSVSTGTAGFIRGAVRLLREDVPFKWFMLCITVYGFGNLMSIPVYTIYQVDYLHISAGRVSILTNVTQVCWMLSYVFWGRYIDHGSPLTILVINIALSALIPLNYIFATQVWMLLPMAAIQGVVNAGIELAYFNGVLFFSSRDTSAQYLAMHSLLMGLRGMVAPFFGAWLAYFLHAHGIDIRVVFGLGAFLVALGAALQWYGLKTPSLSKAAAQPA